MSSKFFKNIKYEIPDKKDIADRELSFVLDNCNIAIANGLRRTILSDVPVYAFEPIEIVKNATFVGDEYIKQRFGLININNMIKGADYDKVTFELNVKCDNDCVRKEIYSKDIISSNGIKYFNENILLFIIKRGQYLHIKAKLNEGTSRENAKFCSACVVKYNITDKKSKYKNIEYEQHNFNIEGSSCITPDETLKRACSSLKELFIKQLEVYDDGNEEKIKVFEMEKGEIYIKLMILDHTFGNCVATEIYSMYPEIEYVSYKIKHPLMKEMDIIIKSTKKDPVEIYKEALQNLIKHFDEMEKDVKKIKF